MKHIRHLYVNSIIYTELMTIEVCLVRLGSRLSEGAISSSDTGRRAHIVQVCDSEP